jgi:hypothetical protein
MLGSYALPKTLLRVEVKGTDLDPAKAQTIMTALEEVTVADDDRIYCLDHLSSPTAKDDINIVRGAPVIAPPYGRNNQTSTNLLSFISSNSIDYTADIIRKLIRAAFIAISGKPDFTPIARSLKADTPDLKLLANITFDPFSTFDVVRANSQLRSLGYCVLLEIGDVDTVAVEGQRFCSNHRYLEERRARFAEAYANYQRASDLPSSTPGILYRPRIPFRVFVYAKDDPKGSTAWKLVQTAQLKLENISPVVSIGVNRAIFSARRTAFLFDRGVLVGWCVSKRSELLSAVEIPLEVVRSIVALPTQVLQVRIDEVTKSNELLRAQTDLIKLQRQYISYILDPKADKPTSTQKASTNPALPTPPAAVFDPAFVGDGAREAPATGFDQVCADPTSAQAANQK